MSEYIEYGSKIAFHPGYYIKELINESGLTQEEFAKRLDTTPKNISILIRGEQSLSIDIALKLSRYSGTTVEYWLNTQSKYDSLVAEFKSQEELEREKDVFKALDYNYFMTLYDLPKAVRNVEEKIKNTREKLGVSTLTVLKNVNLSTSFRDSGDLMSDANVIRANAMLQIAINYALAISTKKYNKKELEKVLESILKLTSKENNYISELRKILSDVGVALVIIPNMKGSKMNGATKKLGDKVMILISDRYLFADVFWFTLFHEIGHVLNGDFDDMSSGDNKQKELKANKFAENMLISQELYEEFVGKRRFDTDSIIEFSRLIGRSPGIVVGRLQNDHYISRSAPDYNSLRAKISVM